MSVISDCSRFGVVLDGGNSLRNRLDPVLRDSVAKEVEGSDSEDTLCRIEKNAVLVETVE